MLKPFVKRLCSSRIKDGVTIWFPKGVSIGKHVSINENVFIDGYGQVEIGNCCRIAHQVSILSEDHGFNRRDKPIYQQKKIKGKVTLEEDVWVGCGARILKGVTIGKGAVIGANSVVTKDIPQYAVAVGVPARVVKYRGEGREDILAQKP
jgi:acetyltransferase-like isoleucine patch superfamily enzyme